MYSGIIQTLASVVEVNKKSDLINFKLKVDSAYLEGIYIGASCAVNGVCFTVVSIENDILEFDAIKETMDCTTICGLKKSDQVHFERSLRVGSENGGHNISGHVHGVCKVEKIKNEKNVFELTLSLPKDYAKYVFYKGFISLHGASLTVSSYNEENAVFGVSLIPETLRQTIFKDVTQGDLLNFEVDQQTKTIVDAVEKTLKK